MASTVSLFNSSSLYCNRSFENTKPYSTFERRFSFTCFSSKKKQLSFMDQILDYIEGRHSLFIFYFLIPQLSLRVFFDGLCSFCCAGGPKLRKWYGAPDLLPKDGKELGEDEATVAYLETEEEEVRDAVLITDGDNEIGQMIILSLILKRVRVKALVKDKRVALEAFGTYVESMAGDTKDKLFLKKALRGVRAVICPILSVYRNSTGIQAVMNSNARKLAEQDENVVKASGVPYSIIRTGILNNTPGGQQGFSFEEGSAAKGSLSKEDAAFICVEALDNVPQKGLIFEVVNGGDKVSDWKECFSTLMDRSAE
ncbi:hypothetical protein DH2020_038197 [Rehmannia glutinosa]|uniref:NAD(P)-binding domain-containing protein n=1 Tax=Rehmannia glutinosa TaxID=99300 RepID=A0ABR0V0I3_REHGL